MELNDAQKKVVDHIDGPCLVVSVPGSGKTATLVERTVNLIQNGVNSKNILCLTFTNKAAKEMKERMQERIGKDNFKSFVGTFHALCLNILRVFGKNVGYSSDLTILDESDQRDMIDKIIRQLGFDKKKDNINVDGIISSLNFLRENLESEEDIIKSFSSVKESNIVEDYFKQIKEHNLIDFSGILYNTYLLLRDNQDVLSMLQQGFQYIQVDEVQDTNLVQFEIVNLIGGVNGNIVLTGDISQSIYKFRNARYQNILDFLAKHKNCKKITLGKNYRSTPQIIAKADKLIRHNKSHMADVFETDNPNGEEPVCSCFYTSQMEAQHIAYRIKDYVNNRGWDYHDIAIFYRLNKLSLELQMALTNEKIPFVVVGGQNFFDRREIKDVIAMLRFASNKKDVLAFHRVASLFKGMGDVSIGLIENESKKNSKSLLEICKDIKNYTNRMSSIKAATQLYEAFEVSMENKKPSDVLSYLVKKINYFEHLEKTCKEDGEANDRIEHVVELIANSEEFSKTNPSIEAYLQNIALSSSGDEESKENCVTLQTLHSAKGLEYPIVFMVGVEDKILPHEWPLMEAKSKGDEELQEAIEEERRICYVGMTRAEKFLEISYCKTRAIRDKSGYMKHIPSSPSRFLLQSGFKIN